MANLIQGSSIHKNSFDFYKSRKLYLNLLGVEDTLGELSNASELQIERDISRTFPRSDAF